MANRYSRASYKEWGQLFGLSAKDLTDQQLGKINADKLIEFLDSDDRVERILGNKLLTCNIDHICSLDFLNETEISKYSYLVAMYNDAIKVREKEIEEKRKESCCYSREKYVIWKLLDDANRVRELLRWVERKESVVKADTIDYTWLCNTSECVPILRDLIVENVIYLEKISSRKRGRCGSAIVKMMAELPQAEYLKHIDSIFECGDAVRVHALSNQYTPKKYIIKALKAVSGKKIIPSVNVKLTKEMLMALPTINRLGVLETLLRYSSCRVQFEDIETSSDLEALLFGALIRHNERVNKVISIFKRLYEPRLVP